MRTLLFQEGIVRSVRIDKNIDHTNHPMLMLLAFALNSLLILMTILLHYETLAYLDRKLQLLEHVSSRLRVLVGVVVIFIIHVIEIWLFGLGYFSTLQVEGMGEIIGATHNLFMDCVYLSFITYTTVGYGDIVAKGYIRYLTGVEALTGLILVTWSASFLFLEMQKYWSGHRKSH